MKSALVLLSFVSVIYCSTEPCSRPTDVEMKCFVEKGTDAQDILKYCKGVDFDALKEGDVSSVKRQFIM